jgi:hypothetical protein
VAGTSSPLAANVMPGAIFLARAIDLKDSKAAQWHPALELVKSFDYEKGQDGGQWFGNFAVTTDSKSTAEKLEKVFEGYVAWVSLHAHRSPALVDMLGKVTFRVDNNVVTVANRLPADQVVAQMPEICKSMHEHFKWHMERMNWHWRMHEKMHEATKTPGK